MLVSTDSEISFDRCEFTQCVANYGGAIYAQGHKRLVLSNSSFQKNIAYQGYGQNIYSTNASQLLKISGCTFESYYNSIYTSGLELEVSSVTMTAETVPPIADID